MMWQADLHVHTDASDDGLSSLAEQAAAARAAGLDAIAVADHNLCTPTPQRLNGVLMIPACEVSTRAGHILGLFLKESLDLAALRAEGLPAGEAAVAEIRARGGLAVLAHPFQRASADPARFPADLDGVEGANARATFHNPGANGQAQALAEARGLPAVGGSDAHSRHEVGNARTLIDAPELTLEALEEAVRAGRCRPLLVRSTPRFRKGLSQVGKARKAGAGPAAVGKKLLYLGGCVLLDAVQPQNRN